MTMSSTALIVLAIAAYIGLAEAHRGNCGSPQGIHRIKIPPSHDLLTLDEFLHFFVGSPVEEAFWVIKSPPEIPAEINYVTEFIRTPGCNNITQKIYSESVGPTPECVLAERHFRPLSKRNIAVFLDDINKITALWSNCPSSYLIWMRCANYFPGKNSCTLEETHFGFFVRKFEDAPLYDIVLDLFEKTGVKFGAADFKWYFTNGKNTLCQGAPST